MLGSNILEVAIGVIFTFLLVSTICTAIREGLESWLKMRATYLEHGIRQLLNDPKGSGIVTDIYNHPLIDGLFSGEFKPGKKETKPSPFVRGKNLPSYIPSQAFAQALMDVVARGPVDKPNGSNSTTILSLSAIRANVTTIQNPIVERVLINAVDSAQGDLKAAQTYLENWFNSGMERVSGWYKRSTQWIIFVIALFVSVGLNVNTIKVSNYLARNEVAAKLIVEKASIAVKDSALVKGELSAAQQNLSSLDLPIGWSSGIETMYLREGSADWWNTFWGPLLGWLITAFAATLGAPFWFDMLNKVMTLRSTIKPADGKSSEGASTSTGSAATAGPVVTYATSTFQPVADQHQDVDNCCVGATTITEDHELPASTGG